MVMMAVCPTGIVGLFARLLPQRRQSAASDKAGVLGEAKP
jgi:hypothetical protein